MQSRKGTVLISPNGKYVIPVHKGGGFGDKAFNSISYVDDLNDAHVFQATEKNDAPYKAAIKLCCTAIPATLHIIREVSLGEE